MPNKQYVKGYAAERSVIRDLEQLGFDARRSAASHGPWDCLGVGPQPPEYWERRRQKEKSCKTVVSPACHGLAPLIASPVAVYVQSKRGRNRPSPGEWREIVDLVVPPGSIKVVLFYPEGDEAVRVGPAARVLWCSLEALPAWFAHIRWLDGRVWPRQPKIRTL